jgi:hypothetical protein
MKKLALISSHCDTPEKIDVLNSNLRTLKSLNIDTFVISAIKIDVDCDFLFITKENPILKWPERSIAVWKTFNYDEKILRFISFFADYGWASLYQIKKIMEFAATYDYDIFYFLIYDLDMDKKIIEDINSNIFNIVYPRKAFNSEYVYPSSVHFSIFNKEKLKIFSSLLDKESYINLKQGVAESYIHQCAVGMGLQNSNYPVTDLICISEKNPFSLSITDKYEFFLNKDVNSNFKIYFFMSSDELTVYVNEQIYKISEKQLLQTNVPCESIYLLKIENSEGIIDYTEKYNNYNKQVINFE